MGLTLFEINDQYAALPRRLARFYAQFFSRPSGHITPKAYRVPQGHIASAGHIVSSDISRPPGHIAPKCCCATRYTACAVRYVCLRKRDIFACANAIYVRSALVRYTASRCEMFAYANAKYTRFARMGDLVPIGTYLVRRTYLVVMLLRNAIYLLAQMRYVCLRKCDMFAYANVIYTRFARM